MLGWAEGGLCPRGRDCVPPGEGPHEQVGVQMATSCFDFLVKDARISKWGKWDTYITQIPIYNIYKMIRHLPSQVWEGEKYFTSELRLLS